MRKEKKKTQNYIHVLSTENAVYNQTFRLSTLRFFMLIVMRKETKTQNDMLQTEIVVYSHLVIFDYPI